MRIQPVQGTGMNAGYDAATKSITISNEGNSPFFYFRVNSKIAKDKQDLSLGYYLYYDFYEVYWDGVGFSQLEGGLSATYDNRETCPKLYAMPYDISDPTNVGNYTANIGISGEGLIYIGRYRGVDSSDGRDVYEFIRSLDPSSKVLIKIDDQNLFINGYYPALGATDLSQSVAFQNKFWAKEINNSELLKSRNYIGFYTGESYDPYPGDPVNSDKRPVLSVINTLASGPTGITVVTDINCVGGSISATYGTFYPSEQAYITQDNKKTFISLTDTPSSYQNAANYYIKVNKYANGLEFTTTPPSTTTVPNLSFINLKDCPGSYPTAYGYYLVTATSAGLVFTKYNILSDQSSVVCNSPSLKIDTVFSLVNDKKAPGPNMYYGTDSEGIKGWYSLPG
ncbi:MAG: hypothetical protein EBR30_10625 [Cytophagia bacterium]|nr:hypothetical protein [Cytophagia bacterium]